MRTQYESGRGGRSGWFLAGMACCLTLTLLIGLTIPALDSTGGSMVRAQGGTPRTVGGIVGDKGSGRPPAQETSIAPRNPTGKGGIGDLVTPPAGGNPPAQEPVDSTLVRTAIWITVIVVEVVRFVFRR